MHLKRRNWLKLRELLVYGENTDARRYCTTIEAKPQALVHRCSIAAALLMFLFTHLPGCYLRHWPVNLK